jgi:hypothetical protein
MDKVLTFELLELIGLILVITRLAIRADIHLRIQAQGSLKSKTQPAGG